MFAFAVTPGLAGRTFGTAARLAYLRYGVLLIGVRVPVGYKTTTASGPLHAAAAEAAAGGSSGGGATGKPSIWTQHVDRGGGGWGTPAVSSLSGANKTASAAPGTYTEQCLPLPFRWI